MFGKNGKEAGREVVWRGECCPLILGAEGPMAQLQKPPGSIPLTQLHEPFMRCLQLGGVDLLENGQCLHRRFLNQESPCW